MSKEITADMVKKLREITGVGMGKCKEALKEAGGDMDAAIDHLRKAGVASAVKKGSREANEGTVGFAQNDSAIALLEVNAETDFVTQNEMFKEFVADAVQTALESNISSVENLKNEAFGKTEKTIEEKRAELVLSLGENIQLRRLLLHPKKENHSYGIYSHMGGKIVALVEISGSSEKGDLARDVAMHVAAEAPDYLEPKDVPENIKEKEKEIAKSQIPAGKPENIVEKILEGKLKTFYEASCLKQQKFIKDTSQTVSDFVKSVDKNLEVTGFVRWQVGEEEKNPLLTL
ncbi:MAG: translation elongation factor Ts [Simkaniaceae bacterium]